MATAWFIVGYCGSGKTHRAEEMVRTLCVKEKFDEGFLICPAQQTELIQALRNGVDCVVVEIGFCLEQNRKFIDRELRREVCGVKIEWEYFEADLQKANENCRRRKDKLQDPGGLKHIEINTNRIGSLYKIPPGVRPQPIYQIPES
jgi:hypothetical protein